jgi:hypothetical protein
MEPEKDDMQDVVGQRILNLLLFANLEGDAEKRKAMVCGYARWVRELKRKADLYDALQTEASNGTPQGS